jgi:hypothetical protein
LDLCCRCCCCCWWWWVVLLGIVTSIFTYHWNHFLADTNCILLFIPIASTSPNATTLSYCCLFLKVVVVFFMEELIHKGQNVRFSGAGIISWSSHPRSWFFNSFPF